MPITVETCEERSIRTFQHVTFIRQPSLIDNITRPPNVKSRSSTNCNPSDSKRQEHNSGHSSQAALPRYSSMEQSPANEEWEEVERDFPPPVPGYRHVLPPTSRSVLIHTSRIGPTRAPKIGWPKNTILSAYGSPKHYPPQTLHQDDALDSHATHSQASRPRAQHLQPYQAESKQLIRRPDVGLPYNSLGLKPTQKARAFTPAQMGKFDGVQSVTTFVNRITSMVNRHGESEVLDVLPLCLEGQAQVWYDSLSKHSRDKMDQDVDIWVEYLQLRFQLDPVTAEKKAEKCKFAFKTESELGLRAYVDRKLILLREAGFDGDYQLKAQIWKGLDPVIQDILPGIRGESLKDFIRRLYACESSARKAWRQDPYTKSTNNGILLGPQKLQRGGGK